MKTTTLAQIKSLGPNKHKWEQLLSGLGKTEADTEKIPYSRILEIRGLYWTLWTTKTEDSLRWVSELALVYARHVAHFMLDPRSINALNVADQFLYGQASWDELSQAIDDADNADYAGPAVCAASAVLCFRGHHRTALFTADTAEEAASLVFAHKASEASRYDEAAKAEAIAAFDAERKWQEQEFLRVVS